MSLHHSSGVQRKGAEEEIFLQLGGRYHLLLPESSGLGSVVMPNPRW